MFMTADRRRRTAFIVVMLITPLAVSAQSAAYTSWEWEGQGLEQVESDTLEVLTPPDDWLARDKAMHAGASFLITISSQYVYESKLDLTQGEALPLSISTALSAGLLKEIMDSQREHLPHFSQRDLVADAVGVLLAAGLILL